MTDTTKAVSGLSGNTKYSWKVKAKNGNITSDYSIINSFRTGVTLIRLFSSEMPEEFKISKCYPNPFNEKTVIKFSVKGNSIVKLRIFDVSGKECIKIMDEHCNQGIYEVQVNFANLSSGIYFCVMQVYDIKDNIYLYSGNLKLAYTK